MLRHQHNLIHLPLSFQHQNCVDVCVCVFCVCMCVCSSESARAHYITILAGQPAALAKVCFYADADWPNKAPLSVKVWREKPITRVRSEDPGY